MRELKFRVWEKSLGMMLFPDELILKKGAKPVDEVMQYTGLKDKNGKEIYEGDIVKWKQIVGPDIVREVQNIKGFHEMRGAALYASFPQINPAFCEVIGNIYENPEMLKN